MNIPTHCDIGGMYNYVDGQLVHTPQCNLPVTHRYHSVGNAPGHWSGRCADHVKWLSAPGLTVEPLCINPEHLEEVSKVENTRRRDARRL